MSRQRILANALVSVPLLSAAVFFVLMEIGTVDRSRCNWDTFENLCSDYDGTYGLAAGLLFLLWAALTFAINRLRTKAR